MKDVYSIYEAKAKLSEIIRRVRNRRAVTITDRGEPVARVVPIDSEENQSLETRLKKLKSRGALNVAERPSSSIGVLKRLPGSVERFLSHDRDES